MNEFKVGLLAIFTIIAVVIMSLKVTSNQSGFGQYITYRTIVKDASGIFPKTPIKVAGINAGRISSIELQGNTALITFEILKQIQVTKNSRLRIKSVGFLGDKYIEIFIGDSQEMLRKFDFIDSEEAVGLENLIKDSADVLTDVKQIVRALKESIAPEGQASPFKKIMSDIQELVANTKDATASLKRMANNNEEKVSALIDNLEAFSSDLAYQSDRKNSDSAMSDIKEVLNNTKKLTSDLEGLVADLRKGKGTLGKMLVEDEIADQVKDTLASVQKIVGKADALRTELSIFSGVNTVSGGDTEAALRIYPSPERFYHLGVATSEIGPDYEKVSVVTTNGVAITENRKENVKNTLRFNAQIGRKIHDFDFRGGLIESTGGLGMDYQVIPLSTKLSVDAFDYKKGKGANVRFGAETQFWNVFYGRAAANDSFRKDRSGTFAAGLKFNDEDLKGLLGFFW
jgi:phospholipid/cholesterol/gamma-HCH transport system substrate-binding protein